MKPEILKNVGTSITTLPENFMPHRGIKRVYDARKQMIESGEGVDWATAEALAFATLLVEGTSCNFLECGLHCLSKCVFFEVLKLEVGCVLHLGLFVLAAHMQDE